MLCTDPASAAAVAARALQRCCKQALLQVLAAAWCCCCNRAYHGHQGSDLRGYDALFITNLALVFPVELRLRCWPGGCGDTKTTGCQIGSAGENLEQEKLCVIFPSHLLFCLVADEEDNNEKMRQSSRSKFSPANLTWHPVVFVFPQPPGQQRSLSSVSYTHLTLPTIYSV